MKLTKKLIIYTVLQALCCCAAPAAFVFAEYGGTSGGLVYKLPLGALLCTIAIVAIAENTLLKPRLTRLSAAIAQHGADLKIEADADKIRNLEAELKRERVLETLLNGVMPVLALAAIFVACKAMERAVIQLSGAIGFTLAAYAVGLIFGVLAAREVHGKHGGGK